MRRESADRPALDELARTDQLLDSLAARADFEFRYPDDYDDQALAALLGEWRDDLRWPPGSALVSQTEAENALREGLTERGRGRKGLATVGSVAATLLLLSGFGAVVADARPGDLLYGLHAMMFNEPRVGDDQIVLSAKADLAKVEQMIAQGQWDQAESQLAEVSTTVRGVNDGGRRQGLLNEVNQLNTKVEKRDPNATVPANSPPQQELPLDPPSSTWTPPAESTPTTTTSPGATTTRPKTTTTPPSPAQSTTPTTSAPTSKAKSKPSTPSTAPGSTGNSG